MDNIWTLDNWEQYIEIDDPKNRSGPRLRKVT